ncbi:hypothetical protein JRQ81_009900 [Phrynocephalus forsythii]|uniref:Uncharacterized protein n=1 Tax=Phrynocephalus forsythii TaxID=171643 RepID=A0A9Q0X9E3_9SAUR|nr:hypothetical protein JRQ81_009900 [Phrynocephalus forsythii]
MRFGDANTASFGQERQLRPLSICLLTAASGSITVAILCLWLALSYCANRNCKAEFLNTELSHVNWALQANGYSKNEIKRAIKLKKQPQTEEDKQLPTNNVFLPYIKGVWTAWTKC